MTTLTHVRVRTPVAVSSGTVALVALAGVGAFLAVTGWGTWGDPGRDTGYEMVAGLKVADGQIPYADFTYAYGPLAPLLQGLVTAWGGGGIASATILGMAAAAAIAAATFSLARQLAGTYGALAATALTLGVAFAPTNYSYVLPHAGSAPLAVLGCLCFLLALARYARTGAERALVSAGVAAGLVALTRLEFTAAVLAAGALWLVMRVRTGHSVRRETLLLAGPALAIPAAVYGAFMAKVGPRELIDENLYPTAFLKNGGSANLRGSAPLDLQSAVAACGRLAAYALGAAALVWVARRVLRRVDADVAIGVAVVLAVLVVVVRPETLRYYLQYAYGWVPLGVVLLVAVLVVRAWRRRTLTPEASVLIAGGTILAVVAARSYDAFFLFSERPQIAAYAAPFVAILLARLHLVTLARGKPALVAGAAWLAFLAVAAVGLTVHDAAAKSGSIHGPGGTLRVAPADEAMYQRALQWIDASTPRGGPVLLAPQLTVLYPLSGRTDPLPEISLLPGALSGAGEEERAIGILARSRVRLAITDRHPFTEYGQTRFGVSFDQRLARWIKARFIHVATLRPQGASSHTLDVWLRRTS